MKIELSRRDDDMVRDVWAQISLAISKHNNAMGIVKVDLNLLPYSYTRWQSLTKKINHKRKYTKNGLYGLSTNNN